MRRFRLLLFCAAALAGAAELPGVHSVYLLPMGRGLDQYLANRLTNEHVFLVVTDPKSADAFFTDRIGESFETQVANLLPPPPAPPKPEPKDKEKEKDKDQPAASRRLVPFGDTANKLPDPSLNSSFGKARGTVFLVDAKTHQVLWSTFEAPKGSGGHELDRTASDIVSRLKKELNPAKK